MTDTQKADYFETQAVLGRTERAAQDQNPDDWWLDSIEVTNQNQRITFRLLPSITFEEDGRIHLLSTWHWEGIHGVQLRLPDNEDTLKLAEEVLARNRRLANAIYAAKVAFKKALAGQGAVQ